MQVARSGDRPQQAQAKDEGAWFQGTAGAKIRRNEKQQTVVTVPAGFATVKLLKE